MLTHLAHEQDATPSIYSAGETYLSSSPHAVIARELLETMSPPVPGRSEPVSPDPPLFAAGADEAEADPPDAVAADPSIVDTERDPLDSDGVEDDPMVKWNELLSKVPRGSHLRGATFDALALAAEHVRRARLSRWQEQR